MPYFQILEITKSKMKNTNSLFDHRRSNKQTGKNRTYRDDRGENEKENGELTVFYKERVKTRKRRGPRDPPDGTVHCV